MKKIIITKNQLKLITEALGVPDNILDAADMLYDVVERDIKSIDTNQDEYTFDGSIQFELGDKKKIKIDSYELTVNLERIDGEEGVLDIVQMGMGGSFGWNTRWRATRGSAVLVVTGSPVPGLGKASGYALLHTLRRSR